MKIIRNSQSVQLMKNLSTLTTVALTTVSLLCVFSAHAAIINWGTPTYDAADTDVKTTGTLEAAYSLSNASVTINTVDFLPNSSLTLLSGGSYDDFELTTFTTKYGLFQGGNNPPFNALSANYTNLLCNGTYGGSISGTTYVATPTIIASNLLIGENYEIQVWVDDSRTGRAAANYADLFSAGGNDVKMFYNSTGAIGGVGMWSLGTFTADGSIQPFSILGNIASGMADTYLNAVQLRDLGPSVFGVAFWNGNASGTLDKTSANFCGNSSLNPISYASLNTIGGNTCYFYDGYYASGVSNQVTQNNISVTSGGFALSGTVHFMNSVLDTYILADADSANGINGSTAVYKSGNGTLILDNPNQYSGGTIISYGTVQLGEADANGASLGTGPVVNDGTLLINLTGSPTINNAISGFGPVTWEGSSTGTLTLGGINTYIGKTTIPAGASLTITGALTGAIAGNPFGSAFPSAYPGAIAVTSPGILTYNSSTPQTNVGVISGSGSLVQSGSGTVELAAANTYTGGTTISTGCTLSLNSATGAGASTGTIALNGTGTLNLNVAGTYAYPITSLASDIVNLGAPSGNTLLTGSLTGFTGTMNVGPTVGSLGQVVINNANNAANPISASATWNIANGATLDCATPYVTDAAQVILHGPAAGTSGALRLDACNQTGNVTLMGNSSIGNGNASISTISGIISDSGGSYGITQVGTASTEAITLTAANTYHGATVISNGTLLLGNGTGSIANSSSISLANGTTFDVSSYLNGYPLGASQTLATLGGTATINGELDATSGCPISLVCSSNNTPLVVTGGPLLLNNNPITVTLTPPTTVTSGQVLLMTGVSGTVGALTFIQTDGTPITQPTLSVSGGSLYLNINSPVIESYSPYTATNLFIFGGTGATIQGVPPTLSVTAVGTPTPTYQWYSNGIAITTGPTSGTGPTLTYPATGSGSLPAGRQTNYCLVQNSSGATSNIWVIDVVATNTLAAYPLAVLQTPGGPPVAYWRLDEASQSTGNGNRPVNDWIGGNMGVYTNVNLGSAGYGFGASGTDPLETAADFGVFTSTGSDATIPLSNPNLLPDVSSGSAANMTVECWINAPKQNGGADAAIVSHGIYSDNDDFVLAVNSGGSSTDRYLRFYVRPTSGTAATTTSANVTPSGSYQHLVGVMNESAGTVSLYINGVQSGSSAAIPLTGGFGYVGTSTPLLIGSETGAANGGQWDGIIDDVAIYNYALTPAEILAHYTAGVGFPVVSLPASTNVNQDATVTLSALVSGTAPVTQGWSDSGNTVGGLNTVSNATTLTFVANATDTYTIKATNAFTSPTTPLTPPSASEAVTVHTGAPSFASPGNNITPSSISVYTGTPVTFSVLAYGTAPLGSLSYQWYNGAGPIGGATATNYTINAPEGISTYYCIVTGSSSSTSATATLTGVPPAIDHYATTVLANNPPIAYWRLNEAPDNGSGNYGTTAYDYVGGHNASYNGVELDQPGVSLVDSNSGALFGTYANPNSYAGELNLSSSGIQPIDVASANAEFSVEAWVMTTSGQNNGAGILAKGYGTTLQFALTVTNNDFYFVLYQSTSDILVVCPTTIPVNDGVWHHLVGVSDVAGEASAAGVHFYVDGGDVSDAFAQSGKGAEDPGSSAAQDRVCIGARPSANSDSFPLQWVGSIAEVGIYNYAMSATQVAAHHTAGTYSPQISQIPAFSITSESYVPGANPPTTASVALTWTSTPNYTYQVQAASTLGSPTVWANIGSAITATGATTTYVDTSSYVTSGAGAYYQVIGYGYYPGY